MTAKEHTQYDLEALFLLALLVAGKTGRVMQRILDRFLSNAKGEETPFEYIQRLLKQGGRKRLHERLATARTGMYTKVIDCMAELFRQELDIRVCSIDELETLPGVGPKTSRFFIAYSRPEIRVAILDIHIMRFMRDHGIDTPNQTPQNRKRYAELETQYLELADRLGIHPTKLDDDVWQERAWRPVAVESSTQE